jgi:hypothetical protein
MHTVDIQMPPPRPGRDQISVNCSEWELFDHRPAFGRQWVIRGLQGRDDITTVEVIVSRDRIVTMVVEPGIPPNTMNVRGQLAVEGQPEPAFVTLQHRSIDDRPGATIFAPVDLDGLKALLEALWQGAGMKLTLVAGERELIHAPLYNDASYREVYQQV